MEDGGAGKGKVAVALLVLFACCCRFVRDTPGPEYNSRLVVTEGVPIYNTHSL